MDRIRSQSDVALAAAMVAFMVIMLVPLPAMLMDLLLAISIALSLLILLVTLYVKSPVDFSIFPMVLLATTLYRLSLNVASSRLILLHGADGEDAAGEIIRAFGQVIVGGSYVVGLVVFTILVVINFVVITKGAGRIAEVAARFTLDAMPGKQMAVDAELNAGLIDETTARQRRDDIAREADFYGAMDGASKFIRGDAIAGIVITLVNIIGGILIGTLQGGMPLGDAARVYTVLTIGDGLVSQVPALIISAAAGMLVTRVTDDRQPTLVDQVQAQLFNSPRALGLLAVALGFFVLVPGLRIPFLFVGGLAGYAAWRSTRRNLEPGRGASGQLTDAEGEEPTRTPEPPVEALLKVEPLAVEFGVDLVGLVDERRGGNLVERIQRIRRQLAQDLGFVAPPVHLRDNLKLESGEYRILLRGEEVARGRVMSRQLLAINPGEAVGKLKGVKGKDPVFGLEAWWIAESQRLKAQGAGFTVVDVPTVLTTHLTKVLQQNGHELYSRQHLADMLDRLQQESPRLVEDLIPDPLNRSALLRVFRNLLREGVSVRDAQTILEALADHAGRIKDPDVLTEFVRQRLARHLTLRYSNAEGAVSYIGFAPDAEDVLTSSLASGEGGQVSLNLDPEEGRKLLTGLRAASEQWRGSTDVVILAPPLARGALRRLTEKLIPSVPVLSPAEILPSARLERVNSVTLKSGG